MNISLLKKIGFSDKSAKVYLALIKIGPSSVRKLAEICDLNRGTTYDALKWLQDQGVVNYYKNESKQYFVAENPQKLHNLLYKQKEELGLLDNELNKAIPELEALYNRDGDRPVVSYYSRKEIIKILEDVLETCENSEENLYRIYSAEGLREYLYKDFSTFSDARVAKGIKVKVIAFGEGGELRGLDERKWLDSQSKTPNYIIIYSGKTAYISLDAKDEPIGVVIENNGVYETQKLIFDKLWKTL